MRRASLMRSAAFAAALAAGAALGASTAGAIPVVTNAGFDSGVDPGPNFVTVFAGDSTSITGWTVGSAWDNGGGSVDYISNYWEPSPQGGRNIDLNGTGFGTIEQSVSGWEVGHKYKISFYLAGNPDNTQGDKTGTITAFANNQSFLFNTVGRSLGDMAWTLVSYEFTANAGTTLLKFTSTTTDLCCYGAAIDGIQILDQGRDPAFTPLPAALPLFAGGLGLIGLIAHRRKRKAATAAA